MSELQSRTFTEEAKRIRFRQDLMSCSGGIEWLLKMGSMFSLTCRALGYDSWGMPNALRAQMHARGW